MKHAQSYVSQYNSIAYFSEGQNFVFKLEKKALILIYLDMG